MAVRMEILMVDMRVVSMVVSWDQRRVVGKDVKMVIYLALSLAELMAEIKVVY